MMIAFHLVRTVVHTTYRMIEVDQVSNLISIYVFIVAGRKCFGRLAS